MTLQIATAEHEKLFAAWRQADRLETLTCRPVLSGQRLPVSSEIITWVFLTPESQEPAGRFFYFDVNPRNRSAEFGYSVNPKLRNQGIGTQMLTLAISRIFATTDLNKLYCQTGAFNLPSIRLLEKLGFQRDGVLREHHELNGQLWDDYLYALLRHEWTTSGSDLPASPKPTARRVLIRPPVMDDWAVLLSLHQRSQALHFPWVFPALTAEACKAYINRCQNPDFAGLLICDPETQQIIGVANLSQIFYKAFQNAYLGYYADINFAGQGLMFEGMQLVIDHAFNTLGLHRIEANIQPGNFASIRLVKRLGFTKEGFSRRYLKVNDKWCDHERWALTAETWLPI
jgi:ribosomal-protein-alanine N-acetyltransferase